MNAEYNKHLARRWWEEMWNRWEFALARDIATPDINFRGSLGREMQGIPALHDYMRIVRDAFPDFYNQIDELVADAEHVAARLTFSGTHKGELFGYPPTGRKIQYAAAAFFTVKDGKIASGWVLGDLHALREQLAGAPATMP